MLRCRELNEGETARIAFVSTSKMHLGDWAHLRINAKSKSVGVAARWQGCSCEEDTLVSGTTSKNAHLRRAARPRLGFGPKTPLHVFSPWQ